MTTQIQTLPLLKAWMRWTARFGAPITIKIRGFHDPAEALAMRRAASAHRLRARFPLG